MTGAGLVLLLALAGGDAPSPRDAAAAALGFSEGQRPLVVDAGALSLSAEGCRECHAAAYESWSRSRHASATTNALFQQGHRVEPRRRCVRCHAPLREQQAFVQRGRTRPGTLAEEGVNCAVCHIRAGRVLTAGEITDEAARAHPMRREPLLAKSELCGACHQFRFVEPESGALTPVHAQLTYDEWRAWRDAGGKASCQTCHMSDHAFPAGAHDDEALARALEVRVEGRTLTMRPRQVGHRFPSGDVYRHLTVEAEVEGAWVEVHRAGLTLGFARKGGATVRVRAADNRLHPTETRAVVVPEGASRVRVVYRFTTALNVERGRLPPEVAERVLFEAALAP